MSKIFAAVSTLIGTIIGAGILGIPYVIMKSGFGLGIVNLIVLGGIMCLTNLYLGEISLRTKQNHHLTGYAELYLGKKAKGVMFLAFTFGIYAALLAYLIGEGESLSQLLTGSPNYVIHFGVLFWVLLSSLSYYGLKALEEGESIGISLILLLVGFLIIFSWGKIDVSNLTYNNVENIFLPFGVILFAYLGFASIPEVERILGKDKKLTKRSIIYAYSLCFLIYAIFAGIVLGYKGDLTPQIATLALGKPFILLGVLTMFTSYLSLSMALIDTLRFDFKKSKFKAWLITISLPLILFLVLEIFNIAQFTKVLAIGGAIAGGLTAILILLMVESAKKNGDREPEYSIPYSKFLTWILIAIFVVGAGLEVFNSF